MKYILILFTALYLLQAESITQIDQKITKTKKELFQRKKKLKTVKLTLEELGKKIIKHQKLLKKLSKKIANLEVKIENSKSSVLQKKKKIKKLKEKKEKIIKQKNIVERNLIDIIVKNLSFEIIKNDENKLSEDDIIYDEVFKKLSNLVKKDSKTFQEKFINFQQNISMLNKEIEIIDTELKKLFASKDQLQKLKKKESNSLSTLNKEKLSYKKALSKLIKEQENREKLLNLLKITKQKAVEKERLRRLREAQRKKQQEAKRRKTTLVADKIKIKQVGSSYQATKIRHYRGKKVRPPLEKFKIIKKFGPYIDPVYNIKIHNDSITMQSLEENAIVRNIMDGKVIFAKEMNMLGKIVIIKHKNNLHTIYSNLLKIAPGIKPGRFIKKRNAIGRIKKELKFEITKADIPINPLEVISF